MTAQMSTLESLEDFRELEGRELFASAPIEITKADIQAFCRATGNEEWIHWDEERCIENQLGGIIAPAFMASALVSKAFFDNIEINFDKVSALFMGVDRLRLINPVVAGSKLIVTVTLKEIEDRHKGIAAHYDVLFTLEASNQAACSGTFIIRYW